MKLFLFAMFWLVLLAIDPTGLVAALTYLLILSAIALSITKVALALLSAFSKMI